MVSRRFCVDLDDVQEYDSIYISDHNHLISSVSNLVALLKSMSGMAERHRKELSDFLSHLRVGVKERQDHVRPGCLDH